MFVSVWSAIFLIVLASLGHWVKAAPVARMYWSTRDPEKNLQYVRQYAGSAPISSVVSGVLLCCNLATLSPNEGFTGKDLRSQVQAYKQENLTVHLVVALHPTEETLWGLRALKGAIPKLADWVNAQDADGVVIDYEPSRNYTDEHVKGYTEFLTTLSQKVQAQSQKVGCDLAGWGILDRWSAFAATPVDFVTTMSPWYQGFGGNITELKQKTEVMIAPGAFPPHRVHLGLSNQCQRKPTCDWTETELSAWVDYLKDKGFAGIDVWTPDSPQNPPTWEYNQLKRLHQSAHAQQSASHLEFV